MTIGLQILGCVLMLGFLYLVWRQGRRENSTICRLDRLQKFGARIADSNVEYENISARQELGMLGKKKNV